VKIHLLYFEGCPNVEEARENLKTALSRADLALTWVETDLRSGNAPKKWRGFPSPTILINGRDIATGRGFARGAESCRFGGAPSVAQIAAALGVRGRIS